MKKLWTTALFVLGCFACTHETEDEVRARPASCDPTTQRVGTYMMTWMEQSGTCGEIEPGLVTFNSDGANPNPDTACVLNSEAWGEGGCKLERSISCDIRVNDPAAWGGYSVVRNDSIFVTRQVTADGARIEGTVTMVLSGRQGSCRSTYSVVAVRQ